MGGHRAPQCRLVGRICKERLWAGTYCIGPWLMQIDASGNPPCAAARRILALASGMLLRVRLSHRRAELSRPKSFRMVGLAALNRLDEMTVEKWRSCAGPVRVAATCPADRGRGMKQVTRSC